MKKQTWQKILSLVTILILFMTASPVTGLAEQNDSALDPPVTGFEERDGEEWTTHEEELEFLEEVAELSDRVSYSEIGTTEEGRPLHLVRVGFPEPPSDEDIADGRNMLVIGTQHGNEGAPREMALQLLRDLAFTDDPELLEQLSEATILFIPTANPDGREANTRSNSDGIDINREHLSLSTLEVQAIAGVLDQFTPDITVDGHERPRDTGNPDVEMLWPRNLNVDEQLRGLNQELVEDYLFPAVENAGFSTGLYGTPGGAGGGDERILRNMIGLRNGLGVLTETAGLQEPTYRVEAQMSTVETVLAFYRERFEDVATVVDEAPERQAAVGNDPSEPFYLDGADNWDPTNILEKKPSGYLLTAQQVDQMNKHVDLFSLETENVDDHGVFVTMDQPMMTVIPFLLDERATYNEVDGLALYDSTDVGTAANMKSLVEHFEEEGEFANASDARNLKMHLTALDRFEKQGAADKVVKHMNSFSLLLNHQNDNELISEMAYADLNTYAEFLLEKWDIAFDSSRAMDHVSYLSEELGPRVTGTETERQAAEYIKNEFDSLGYDVSTQEFDIRGEQTSQNVIAVKKPEDIENPEIVYIGAHYDSVSGSPGANDNASGTASILEIARVMKDSPTNKEIRFIAFGAEEIGLVGSRHYVSQLTEDEIDRSVANYNLDMVGTNWEPASQLYISPVDGDPNNLVWESSVAAAERIGLEDDKINLYAFSRSDHVPFYDAGIDSALFIWREPGTAALEPYYHTPQDTIENVSPERIQIVGDLIHSAVSDLVSQPVNQETIMEEAS